MVKIRFISGGSLFFYCPIPAFANAPDKPRKFT